MMLGARVRTARRHAGITQAELAERVGVSRSAVANWESNASGIAPSSGRLCRIALETGVAYEWLATGRGRRQPAADDIPAIDAEFVDDPAERLLLEGFRAGSERLRQAMLLIAEAAHPGRPPRGG